MVYKQLCGHHHSRRPSTTRNGCAQDKPRARLNHFEVQVSQSRVDVYGSDFSTDNGQTFANYKLLYSANISLPFTRGYVHFNPRNHATVKYGFGPDVVFHWDNIGFRRAGDCRAESVRNPGQYRCDFIQRQPGAESRVISFWTERTGKAAGIYSPSTKINSLTFQNVNTSGMTSATLTLNAFFNAGVHTASSNWGISYRFNGGTWRNRNLTAGDLAAINTIAGAPYGQLSMSLDVPVADLVSGNNTLELLPLNAPMDYPPVVANIDLILGTPGSVNTSPTPSPTPTPTVSFSANPTNIASGKVSVMTWSSTNATSCTASGGWTGTKAISGTLRRRRQPPRHMGWPAPGAAARRRRPARRWW